MILKQIKNCIKSLDFFGDYIHLRINSQTTSKTFIGGFASILTILAYFLLFIIMSLDMFNKDKPIVDLENKILPKSPNLTLDSYSLPISINLQDSLLKTYNLPNIFVLEAYLVTRVDDYLNSTELVLENCTIDNFPQISNNSYYNLQLYNNLCIKFHNLSIGGNMQENYLQYIAFGLKLCINSTKSKILCASENEIKEFFENNTFYMNLYFQNNIINTQNYLMPETPFMKNIYKIIKYGMYKECGLFLKNQILLSDNGFIFETINQYKVVSYDQEYYEFSDMIPDDGYLCSFFIYSSNLMEIYRRNYIKIQDILASVGALLNICVYFLQLFISIFSSMAINQNILNKVYDFYLIKRQHNKEKTYAGRRILKTRPSNNITKDLQKKGDDNKSEHSRSFNKIENKSEIVINPKIHHHNFGNKSSDESTPESIDILKFIESQNKKNSLKLNYLELLKMYICNCCSSQELKDKKLLYKKSLDCLDDYLDISYIISKLEEFEKLKLLLLSQEQLAVFNFIAKDICTLDDLNYKENKIGKYKQLQRDSSYLANTIAKFKIRVQEKDNLTEIDRKIYYLLREDLKY
jgi:hypothetical protein